MIYRATVWHLCIFDAAAEAGDRYAAQAAEANVPLYALRARAPSSSDAEALITAGRWYTPVAWVQVEIPDGRPIEDALELVHQATQRVDGERREPDGVTPLCDDYRSTMTGDIIEIANEIASEMWQVHPTGFRLLPGITLTAKATGPSTERQALDAWERSTGLTSGY